MSKTKVFEGGEVCLDFWMLGVFVFETSGCLKNCLVFEVRLNFIFEMCFFIVCKRCFLCLNSCLYCVSWCFCILFFSFLF